MGFSHSTPCWRQRFSLTARALPLAVPTLVLVAPVVSSFVRVISVVRLAWDGAGGGARGGAGGGAGGGRGSAGTATATIHTFPPPAHVHTDRQTGLKIEYWLAHLVGKLVAAADVHGKSALQAAAHAGGRGLRGGRQQGGGGEEQEGCGLGGGGELDGPLGDKLLDCLLPEVCMQ